MTKINDLSRKIDLNNLIYYFKNKSISLINFIGRKGPLHLYRYIFDGNIKLAKSEKDLKLFKLNLNEITKGNPKNESKDQIKTAKNIKTLYESRVKITEIYNDYAKIRSKSNHNSKHCSGLKILTPKQMLQRLPIVLV